MKIRVTATITMTVEHDADRITPGDIAEITGRYLSTVLDDDYLDFRLGNNALMRAPGTQIAVDTKVMSQ